MAEHGQPGGLDLETAPNFLSQSEIRGHPRFPLAFDTFVDAMAGLYTTNPRLRILIEYRRFIVFGLIVCLDAARDPDKAETLVTTSRVAAAVGQMGVTGDRVIAEIIAGMRDDGYVTFERAEYDRRVREIRPTEKMMQADLEWIDILHAPLAAMKPEVERYRLAVARDRAYHHAYRVMSLPVLPLANQVMVSNPEADYFVRAAVGTRVMMVLFQSIRGRDDRTTAPGFYSYAAERSGVSRPHVSGLLKGAEERGLVELTGRPAASVRVTPKLYEGMQRWTAACLSATDLTSTLAWPPQQDATRG